MDTPVGNIYTTTSLKAFVELTGMTPEQYILGINDGTLGDGAKITLAELLVSSVSADVGNLLEIGTDSLLNVPVADIASALISSQSGVINLLELGADDKLLVTPENVSENAVSADADNALSVGTDGLLFVDTFDVEGADVDLSNLSSIGEGKLGVKTFDNKGTVTTDITLAEDVITTGDWSDTNTITLPTVTDTAKQVVCVLDFTTANSGQPTITNTNLKWSNKNNGLAPTSYSTLSGVRNVLTFKSIWINSELYWEAEYSTFGASVSAYTFPNLSENGTLGGASEAVSSDSEFNSSYAAWKAVDGSNSTEWRPTGSSQSGHYFTWYSNNPFLVTQYNFYNGFSDGGGTYVPIVGTFYYSDDGTNWVLEKTFTNAVTSFGSSWSIAVDSSSQGYHKYRKLVVTATSNGVQPMLSEARPVGYKIEV